MKYYYACSYPLEVGSVVKSGNWGRMIKKYNPNCGNAWLFIRELIYEEVRLKNFTDKPSRFEGIFLCKTLEDIKSFISKNTRIFDIIYEVELVDEHVPSHLSCVVNTKLAPKADYRVLTLNAESYWAGLDIKEEFLTLSDVRIVKRL